MPNTDVANEIMTLPAVATYLQVKERTIYEWAQSGAIPSFKLGKVWRFKRDEIDQWIEERKRETPRPKARKSGGRKKHE